MPILYIIHHLLYILYIIHHPLNTVYETYYGIHGLIGLIEFLARLSDRRQVHVGPGPKTPSGHPSPESYQYRQLLGYIIYNII